MPLLALDVLACLVFSASTVAQPVPDGAVPRPAEPPAAAVPAPTAPAGAQQPPLAPSQKLGLRAAMVRSRLPVNPTLVIVPDLPSYIAAIDGWNIPAGIRYPVLIDDGSWPARQAIARFNRAMKPKAAVRWSTPDAAASWPQATEARRRRIESVIARAWGATPAADADAAAIAESTRAAWSKVQLTPPGLVVANVADPAIPAALALAASRGQLITWQTGVGQPDGYMQPADAALLQREIKAAAAASTYSFESLGDDLDSITVCLNCATKVYLGSADQRAMLSLTDWLGRTASSELDAPPTPPGKQRWAWAGQIIGSQWQTAYAAMSSLFLETNTAWLFDGYDAGPPWNAFDMTEAGRTLEKGGISIQLDDDANRSIGAWLKRAAGVDRAASAGAAATRRGGVNASLIFVNSSGNQDFFDLKPGQARPVDIPILRVPAMVHFVHSWSAAAPSDITTVAGRWLERGSFAYVGSVHEPYLQAFVPTPKLVNRLGAGLPLGAAARIDSGEVWKISILGDPLFTLSKPGPVVDRELPLEGARDVQAELAAAIRDRQYEQSLIDLVLLARDDKAAQLVAAILHEEPDKLTPAAALIALPSIFIAGDRDTLLAAYRIAQPLLADETAVRSAGLWDARDLLWHALWPELSSINAEQARRLAGNLRAEVYLRDSQDAHAALARTAPDEARSFLVRAKSTAPAEVDREKLDALSR